jgi:hypothetical protein
MGNLAWKSERVTCRIRVLWKPTDTLLGGSQYEETTTEVSTKEDPLKMIEGMKMEAVMTTRDLWNSSITDHYRGSTKVDCHKIQGTKGEVLFH